MPIHSCKLPGGGSGFKYGNKGHCYPTREGALKQMKAMFHNGYTGGEAELDKLIEALVEANVQAIKLPKSHFDRKSAKAWAEEHGFNNEFVIITEDYIVMSQFPPKTSAQFTSLEASDGVILRVEGDVAALQNAYVEALKLKTGDRTKVSTETHRIDDNKKPTVDDLAEVKFLLHKGQFSKESAKEWMKVHHFSKTYKTIPPNFTVNLVEDGNFWRYDNLPEGDFSKFKTVKYDDGVTVILGIV